MKKLDKCFLINDVIKKDEKCLLNNVYNKKCEHIISKFNKKGKYIYPVVMEDYIIILNFQLKLIILK